MDRRDLDDSPPLAGKLERLLVLSSHRSRRIGALDRERVRSGREREVEGVGRKWNEAAADHVRAVDGDVDADGPVRRAVRDDEVKGSVARARRLRDLGRRTVGALYIEYAYESWTDAERARLGHVLAEELFRYRALWDVPRREAVGPTIAEHRLGFLKRSELASVALDAAVKDVVAPPSEIGIALS